MNKSSFLCLIIIFGGLIFALPVSAQSPGDSCSTAGEMVQRNISGTMTKMVCDGSNYRAYTETAGTKTNLQIANDTGSCTADKEGRLRYDTGSDTWDYCNNSGSWVGFNLLGTACTDDMSTECLLDATRTNSDPEFTAANIANGVNILGVTGTLTGGGGDNITCWGRDSDGQASPPAGLTAIQIGAGDDHNCAIESDGSVTCWGNNGDGQASPPAGLTATQIVAGVRHTCAIEPNGSVTCWGDNGDGQSSPPGGLTATKIAAGGFHTCAIESDGSVTCWGNNGNGRASPPAGLTATEIGGGDSHSCAIEPNGSVTCWGYDGFGQASPPAGLTATQIATGGLHSCAVEPDGSVTCWGVDDGGFIDYGQVTGIPAGLTATQVSTGGTHSCAKEPDGSVTCWGGGTTNTGSYPEYGQSIVPAALTATQIAAGDLHNCAISP
jgi:alpha-tubulin suppressor-like RCC1 family protein